MKNKLLCSVAALALMPIAAQAQTGSAKTTAALNTEINGQFPDNTTGLITPAILRQVTLDMVASMANPLTLPVILGPTEFTAGGFQCAGSGAYLSSVCVIPNFTSTNLLGYMMVPTFAATGAGNPTAVGPGMFTAQWDGPAALPATFQGNPWGFGANITSSMTVANTNGFDGPLAFAATVKNQNGGNAKIFGWDWQFNNVGNASTNFGGVMGMSMNVAGQASVGIRMVSQGSSQITTGWDCQQGGGVGNGGYAWACLDAGGNAIRNVTTYYFAANPAAGIVTPYVYGITGVAGTGIQFLGGTTGTPIADPFQFYGGQNTGTSGNFKIATNLVDNILLFEVDNTGNLFLPIVGKTLVTGSAPLLDVFNNTPTIQTNGNTGNVAMMIGNYRNAAGAPYLIFQKSKSGTTGTGGTVANNDGIGLLDFDAYDATGTPALQHAASIAVNADAAPTAGSVAGRIVFSTTPSGGSLTEALRINSAGTPIVQNGVAPPSGGAQAAAIKFSSTANFGLFYGSSAPTLTAQQGSLYIRVDGTASTSLYVNSSAGAGNTWSAVTVP